MIKSLSFKNYKAFSDGKINLKPITILLGANSSGKSSILQLFLLLQQTINNNEQYESALKLNGQFINLGEDENLLKDQDKDQKLGFSFDFENSEYNRDLKEKTEVLRREIREIWMIINGLLNYLENRRTNIFDYNSADFEYHDNIEVIVDKTEKILIEFQKADISDSFYKEFWLKSDVRYYLGRRFKYNVGDLRKIKIQEYKDLFYIYSSLKDIKFRKLSIEYEFAYNQKTKRLQISKYSIKIKKETLICISKSEDLYKLHSDIFDNEILDKYPIPSDYISFNGLELFIKDQRIINVNVFEYEKSYSSIFLNNIFNLFSDCYELIESTFERSKINHVGPLRAFPQRYYFLDEANVKLSLNSSSGNTLAEILKKNKNINSRINEWLKIFELNVSVKEFKDIIHNIKIKQNKLDLDITDVGFGISQILPILVQCFMSEENSLTLIEQPEIHLHPKMQASLADLFVEIVKSREDCKSFLIIETHSEYILKRLRRRISEGKIKSSDVAIYFISPRNSKNRTAQIKEINISNNGSFDWPEDFYNTALDDDMVFFSNLSKK